ncbi:MAG: putative glycoside hydrolase [Lachnospiraceae bacterium]|nr:putative glycoside hydrolase [Lachnospiraceae bacterium]
MGVLLGQIGLVGCAGTQATESQQVQVQKEESVSGQESAVGVDENVGQDQSKLSADNTDIDNTDIDNPHIDDVREMSEEAEAAEPETEEPEVVEEAAEDREPVHGIYLSAYVAGSSELMESTLTHLDESAINAVVIDIKNDEGRVTWETGTQIVEEVGSAERLIRDMPGLIETLHAHDIYVIGRFVTFREMYLKDVKPEWMVQNTNGSVYTDKKGFCWIDPANEEAWAYIEEIVEACTQVGFDEIQFDYVRYGTGIKDEMIGLDGTGRQAAITTFATHMEEFFKELHKPYSLDVFGTIINSEIDRKIVGQDYAALAEHTDYLSPMVYPSHYYDGSFGIAYPDEKPYETVKNAMLESNRVLEERQQENGEGEARRARIRPWIQGFTASYLKHYIKYGGEQIREQIRAVYEAGHEEWLIWNPSCKYPWEELTEDKLPQFDEMQEELLQEQAAQESTEQE